MLFIKEFFFFIGSDNNLVDEDSMNICITLNDITVSFFNNNEINKFEPLIYICLYQPNVFLLSTKSYDLWRVRSLIKKNLNLYIY